MVACEKINSVRPFFHSPGNLPASHPNSFDNTFYQVSFASFYFDCIKYFYCGMSSVSGSITVFTRYQGNGSSSICVAMLCVSIGMVGARWWIYSCVNIGPLLGDTFGFFPGLPFSWVSIGNSLGFTFGILPSFLCYGVSTGTSPVATIVGMPGFFLCPLSWCLLLLLTCDVLIRYLYALLFWFHLHLTPLSIIPVG